MQSHCRNYIKRSVTFVRCEVLTAVTTLLPSCAVTPDTLVGSYSVSKKHTASIFRAEDGDRLYQTVNRPGVTTHGEQQRRLFQHLLVLCVSGTSMKQPNSPEHKCAAVCPPVDRFMQCVSYRVSQHGAATWWTQCEAHTHTQEHCGGRPVPQDTDRNQPWGTGSLTYATRLGSKRRSVPAKARAEPRHI
jgi:hypothetical protein